MSFTWGNAKPGQLLGFDRDGNRVGIDHPISTDERRELIELRRFILGHLHQPVVEPWLPIDSAPRNGTSILVTDAYQVDAAYFDYDDWCAPHSSANSIPYSPTQWKHLPDGPNV